MSEYVGFQSPLDVGALELLELEPLTNSLDWRMLQQLEAAGAFCLASPDHLQSQQHQQQQRQHHRQDHGPRISDRNQCLYFWPKSSLDETAPFVTRLPPDASLLAQPEHPAGATFAALCQGGDVPGDAAGSDLQQANAHGSNEPDKQKADARNASRRSAQTTQRHKKVERGYPCEFEGCDKLFDYYGARRKHYSTAHVPKDQRPFQCSLCQKRFVYMKDVNRHKHRKHSSYHGSRPSTYGLANVSPDPWFVPWFKLIVARRLFLRWYKLHRRVMSAQSILCDVPLAADTTRILFVTQDQENFRPVDVSAARSIVDLFAAIRQSFPVLRYVHDDELQLYRCDLKTRVIGEPLTGQSLLDAVAYGGDADGKLKLFLRIVQEVDGSCPGSDAPSP